MKIVIVDTTVHGKLIGGGHLYLPNLIAGLVDKGNEVYLVVNGTPNEKVFPRLQASGVIICDKIWQKNELVEKKAYALAKWVNDQRHKFKKGTLLQDRIDQLNDIGFIWDTRTKD